MKTLTTLIAAAFVAGSATLAFAQAGSGGGAGGGGGASGGGAGSDLSTPRKNVQRPSPNSPPVNRRGDDMAPMQGANVSNQMTFSGKKAKQKSQTGM
jgi:hypothetical protein